MGEHPLGVVLGPAALVAGGAVGVVRVPAWQHAAPPIPVAHVQVGGPLQPLRFPFRGLAGPWLLVSLVPLAARGLCRETSVGLSSLLGGVPPLGRPPGTPRVPELIGLGPFLSSSRLLCSVRTALPLPVPGVVLLACLGPSLGMVSPSIPLVRLPPMRVLGRMSSRLGLGLLQGFVDPAGHGVDVAVVLVLQAAGPLCLAFLFAGPGLPAVLDPPKHHAFHSSVPLVPPGSPEVGESVLLVLLVRTDPRLLDWTPLASGDVLLVLLVRAVLRLLDCSLVLAHAVPRPLGWTSLAQAQLVPHGSGARNWGLCGEGRAGL